ncbi:nuclear transport factor 2 family protein [Nocardia arthritidis]|uniref:Nuclear transport factor 2 family protein n=1 Tax=Nocardia arthritidis TaxID=228602 RepID=A0A6G9Y4A6_9NOCA|nr:nuclear transport factor 2 family protein [Nocardia arthritidis]QIS08065.1 nuclear transport factor 2 family protein [Nocardia arthritidis]
MSEKINNGGVIGPREMVELMRRSFFGEGGVEFADDAVYETPFALPGKPKSYKGPEAINAHFAERRADAMSAAMATLEIRANEATVYESTDSEVVTFEFELSGVSKVTGEPFRFTSTIGVLTVRNGKIVRWRDYPNFLGAAEVTGARTQLAELIAG